MTEQAGSKVICLLTNEVATDNCPCGGECRKEECEEYQIVYSG